MFRHDDYFSMRMAKKASDNTNAVLNHDSVFVGIGLSDRMSSAQCVLDFNVHCKLV